MFKQQKLILSRIVIFFIAISSNNVLAANPKMNSKNENSMTCSAIFDTLEKLKFPNTKNTATGCTDAFRIYKENLKRCNDDPNIDTLSGLSFSHASFYVGNCYKNLKQTKNAIEVYEYNLKHPQWTGFDEGRLSWESELESLRLSDKPQSCVNEAELVKLLNEFQKNHNVELLEKIRTNKPFAGVNGMEGYDYPFSSFKKDLIKKMVNSKLTLFSIEYHHKFSDRNVYTIAVNGFQKFPDEWLILIFSDTAKDSKTKNASTSPNACYQLTEFELLENKEELRSVAEIKTPSGSGLSKRQR